MHNKPEPERNHNPFLVAATSPSTSPTKLDSYGMAASLLLTLGLRPKLRVAAGNLWEFRYGLAPFLNLDLAGIDNYGWQNNSRDTYDLLDFVICNKCKAIIDMRGAPCAYYLPFIPTCRACASSKHYDISCADGHADYSNIMLYQSYSLAVRKSFRKLLHARGLKEHEQK